MLIDILKKITQGALGSLLMVQLANAAEIPLIGEYLHKPFSDIGAWKFSFISAAICAIVLTIIFAKVAETGRDSELSVMLKMVAILTPILTLICRLLLW